MYTRFSYPYLTVETGSVISSLSCVGDWLGAEWPELAVPGASPPPLSDGGCPDFTSWSTWSSKASRFQAALVSRTPNQQLCSHCQLPERRSSFPALRVNSCLFHKKREVLSGVPHQESSYRPQPPSSAPACECHRWLLERGPWETYQTCDPWPPTCSKVMLVFAEPLARHVSQLKM